MNGGPDSCQNSHVCRVGHLDSGFEEEEEDGVEQRQLEEIRHRGISFCGGRWEEAKDARHSILLLAYPLMCSSKAVAPAGFNAPSWHLFFEEWIRIWSVQSAQRRPSSE